MENFAAELGKRLREARLKKGISQKELGEALSATQAGVSQWENGRVLPEIPHLAKIAVLLEVSVDKLLGLKGGEN